MLSEKNQGSQIVDWYNKQSIFITGATGFVGKVLLEKLLRECKNIKNIYILIRPKSGKTTEERLQQTLESPVST